uniref:Uncharacterized protein n=1 Tax=Arundo donax TaxID=35708 RepID=A0A0A9F3P3_ARUDO
MKNHSCGQRPVQIILYCCHRALHTFSTYLLTIVAQSTIMR